MLITPPPPDLRAWIQAGVVMQADATLPASHCPALTTAMLVVRLSGQIHLDTPGRPLLPAAALILPSTRFTRFLHTGAVSTVGLVLQPAALAAVLRDSAERLADAHLPLDAVFGPWINAVVEAIQASTSAHARLALLFDAIRRHVADARHDAVRAQLQQVGMALEQGAVAASHALGVGERQLQRRCLAAFGLTPKQYHNISRMHAAMRAVLRGQAGNGAELALRHGFFDQSHLARDMRRLAGVPLGALAGSPPGPASEHWPLAAGLHF